MDEHGRKLGYTWIQLEYCIRIHCIRIWGARIQGGLHIFSYTKRIVLWEFEGPWNRIAKFLNDCLYVKFAIPLCGIFFCGVTPYGLMGWNRALQKNNFSGSMFFSHCFSDKPGFAKKQLFSLKQIVFRMSLVKSTNSTSKPRFSSLQNAQMHTIQNSN